MMYQAPFTSCQELYSKLQISQDHSKIRRQPHPKLSTPTEAGDKGKIYLPSQPRIGLQDPDIGQYLESEVATEELDRFRPILPLVATQNSTHISSLTHQIVRGRNIIITEKPELHLVWIYDRVYIKPVPKYLLSHAFWNFYLVSDTSPIPEPQRGRVRKGALGFLRSYLHLIRHRSDFKLAKDDKLRLLPKKLSHANFVNFIQAFEKVEDKDVSPRYHFGELRLGRLNFWAKILLRQFYYHKVHSQKAAYFTQFYAPLLFLFGVFSVALSAMQVVLAGNTIVPLNPSWTAFADMSRGFSVWVLFTVLVAATTLLFTLVAGYLHQAIFATKSYFRKKGSKPNESRSNTRDCKSNREKQPHLV